MLHCVCIEYESCKIELYIRCGELRSIYLWQIFRLLHSNNYISVVAIGIMLDCADIDDFAIQAGLKYFSIAQNSKRRISRSWYYVRLDAIRLLMRHREDYSRNEILRVPMVRRLFT